MSFRTEIDGGYTVGFGFFLLFDAGFIAATVIAFSIPSLIISILFCAMTLFVLVPMYAGTKYIVEEDGLRVRMGWIKNTLYAYDRFFGYQQVKAVAQNHYGLSHTHVLALYTKEYNGYAVMSISPKDMHGFIKAFGEKTGLEITPPDPTFREIQDEYNKKTSEAQRKAARDRLKGVLFKGYGSDMTEAETPESLEELGELNVEEYEANKAAAVDAETARAMKEDLRNEAKRLRRKGKKATEDDAAALRAKLAAYQAAVQKQEEAADEDAEASSDEPTEE